jgi:hypothetical protein
LISIVTWPCRAAQRCMSPSPSEESDNTGGQTGSCSAGGGQRMERSCH